MSDNRAIIRKVHSNHSRVPLQRCFFVKFCFALLWLIWTHVGEDHERASLVRRDLDEVRLDHGRALAGDHRGSAQVLLREERPDAIVHLVLLHLVHDHDRAPTIALEGVAELLHERHGLVGPAQDDDVVRLHDGARAL